MAVIAQFHVLITHNNVSHTDSHIYGGHEIFCGSLHCGGIFNGSPFGAAIQLHDSRDMTAPIMMIGPKWACYFNKTLTLKLLEDHLLLINLLDYYYVKLALRDLRELAE